MMNKFMLALSAATLAFSGAHAQTGQSATEGEARLAKMIEGRVAGKPQSCISGHVDRSLQIIDKTAVVYDAGNILYVAKPDDPKSLNTDDILVINRFGSQLCRQDIIRTVDRTSGFTTGVIFLGDFVPYKKP